MPPTGKDGGGPETLIEGGELAMGGGTRSDAGATFWTGSLSTSWLPPDAFEGAESSLLSEEEADSAGAGRSLLTRVEPASKGEQQSTSQESATETR